MSVMTREQALATLTDKQTAYRMTFGTPHGKAVIEDLMPFCRARESCMIPGDRDRTSVLEGRREVYLRVRDFLDRPIEELIAMYFKEVGAING